jgi:hypothetical protein
MLRTSERVSSFKNSGNWKRQFMLQNEDNIERTLFLEGTKWLTYRQK